MQHPTRQPNEGVLHDVLGQACVARQEVCEPERLGRVAEVELAEHPALDPDGLHVGLHPGPLQT